MPAFLANLDLAGAELRNAVIQVLAADPVTLVPGRLWYNSDGTGVLRYRNNSTTIDIAAVGDDVPKSVYDANSILKADTDNTPIALTVGASTLVGRTAAGSIDALSASDARTVLGLGALATLSAVDSSTITNGSILNEDINASAAIALSKLATQANGTLLGNNVGSAAVPTALTGAQTMALLSGSATTTFSFNSQLVSGVATPLAGTDAVNKAYVDGLATGLDIKASVRAAATADITIAAPGATIGGVTMVAGDRILLMGQDPATENGIYVFDSDVTPLVRATDADTSDEVSAGMFAFVEEGTLGDRGYVLTTNNPITLGVTPLTFTQFSGAGTVTGTTDRITVTGSQIDIAATYAGQSSIVTVGTITAGTWTGNTIAVLNGGTGATTAAGAKTNLGFLTRFAATIGDGAAVSYSITHSLGTNDVTVEIYDIATKNTVFCDVTRTNTNVVTVSGFITPPSLDSLRVVIVG